MIDSAGEQLSCPRRSIPLGIAHTKTFQPLVRRNHLNKPRKLNCPQIHWQNWPFQHCKELATHNCQGSRSQTDTTRRYLFHCSLLISTLLQHNHKKPASELSHRGKQRITVREIDLVHTS